MTARDTLDLAWLIPAFPAVGAVILVLFGKRIGEPKAGWFATLMMALSFAASVTAFFALRSLPADARANDLAHWQTTLVSQDAEAVARGIRGSPCAMLSPGVVAPADKALGFTKGLLIRDPDGHALAVVQP